MNCFFSAQTNGKGTDKVKDTSGGFRGEGAGMFQELHTVLFEVEMIISNASLTYVYPNTIEIFLTPNHWLFG